MYCYNCKFFVNKYEEKINSMYGTNYRIMGFCSYLKEEVSEQTPCSVDWAMEAWIQQKVEEDE